MGKSKSCTTTPLSEPPEFREILEPLELVAGARLRGWGRRKCLAAYNANPAGFAAVAEEVRRHGHNPPALLVHKVRNGEHLEELPPALPAFVSSAINPSGCTHDACRELEVCRYA